jgi:hypothetical protein
MPGRPIPPRGKQPRGSARSPGDAVRPCIIFSGSINGRSRRSSGHVRRRL